MSVQLKTGPAESRVVVDAKRASCSARKIAARSSLPSAVSSDVRAAEIAGAARDDAAAADIPRADFRSQTLLTKRRPLTLARSTLDPAAKASSAPTLGSAPRCLALPRSRRALVPCAPAAARAAIPRARGMTGRASS
jgi:hypothetical protein